MNEERKAVSESESESNVSHEEGAEPRRVEIVARVSTHVSVIVSGKYSLFSIFLGVYNWSVALQHMQLCSLKCTKYRTNSRSWIGAPGREGVSYMQELDQEGRPGWKPYH